MLKRGNKKAFTRAKEPDRLCEDVVLGWPSHGRFAISDGASISYDSRRWARSLCWRYMRDTNVGPEWLEDVRQRFASNNPAQVDDWAASYAHDRGSYATFVGISIDDTKLRGIAIGDSMLFVITADERLSMHPQMAIEDFMGQPLLLCSRAERGAFTDSAAAFENSEFIEVAPPYGWAGTCLIAVTDALAEWIIRAPEHSVRVAKLEEIRSHETLSSFEAWVSQNIASGEIRRDDCAALIVEL